MLPILTPQEMAEVDANAAEPLEQLIERAGRSVALEARRMLGGVYGRRVSVIAGKGHNGDDARVAARVLAAAGVRVALTDPSVDIAAAPDLVIDGAYGTGLSRPWHGPEIRTQVPVLAIDIPSGVDGRTGAALGRPLAAHRTVTFGALKPGLLLHPGATLAGEVVIDDLGLETSSARAHLLTLASAAQALPQRMATDHKWKHAVKVVGGSPGMTGAPALAGRAALRSGAGLVVCSQPGLDESVMPSELLYRPLPKDQWSAQALADSDRFGAFVVGPGLGRTDTARREVASLLASANQAMPFVIDADALHAIDATMSLRVNMVLTPHDGEFSAVMGSTPGSDRFEAVRQMAAATGATVLLKGPTTIVASPDGRCLATNSGDRRLATAGTGDVLAGIVAALLTFQMDPLEAAAVGAWLHGRAAHFGHDVGMVASDLVDLIPHAMRELTEHASSAQK